MALHKNNKMEGWEKTFSACQIWFILNWTKWFTRWQFHQYQQVWLLRQNILTYTNYTLSLSLYLYIHEICSYAQVNHTHTQVVYIYIHMHRACIAYVYAWLHDITCVSAMESDLNLMSLMRVQGLRPNELPKWKKHEANVSCLKPCGWSC